MESTLTFSKVWHDASDRPMLVLHCDEMREPTPGAINLYPSGRVWLSDWSDLDEQSKRFWLAVGPLMPIR